MPRPTPEELAERIKYDPDTGDLTWLPLSDPSKWRITWNKKFAGTKALNNLSKRGYLVGSWKPYTLVAHRVAWAIYHGQHPTGQIDHINGDRTDNRICNLRDVVNAENARNSALKANNRSGIPGVYRHSQTGKWTAQINSDGKTIGLGCFSRKSDAVIARKAAERVLGYHENHGRIAPTKDKIEAIERNTI